MLLVLVLVFFYVIGKYSLNVNCFGITSLSLFSDEVPIYKLVNNSPQHKNGNANKNNVQRHSYLLLIGFKM